MERETIPVRVDFHLHGVDNEDLTGFWQEARDRYLKWTAAFVDRLKQYGVAKIELEEHALAMENRAAAWVREGVLVDAKNEREREAILTGMKEEDVIYLVAAKLHAHCRRHLLTEAEPALEEAKYHRRLAEEDIKWATAALSAIAGIVEGGRHEHR